VRVSKPVIGPERCTEVALPAIASAAITALTLWQHPLPIFTFSTTERDRGSGPRTLQQSDSPKSSKKLIAIASRFVSEVPAILRFFPNLHWTGQRKTSRDGGKHIYHFFVECPKWI
jgi:hypothetical protein